MPLPIDQAACPFRIRQANLNDLQEVARIWHEGQTAATGVDTPPLTEEQLEYFRKRINDQNQTFQLWVVDSGEPALLGWQALSPMGNHPILRHYEAESSTYVCQRTWPIADSTRL